MLKLINTKSVLLLYALLFVAGFLFVAPPVQAARCTGSADSRQACIDQRIELECRSVPADRAQACVERIRQEEGGTQPQPRDTFGPTGGYICGEVGSSNEVRTVINIGCRGQGNPIMDLLFAIIRFLSIGIGVVLVGSLMVAGIQYTTSRGDAGAIAKAKDRVLNVVVALLIYILAYAILNYLIPNWVIFR